MYEGFFFAPPQPCVFVITLTEQNTHLPTVSFYFINTGTYAAVLSQIIVPFLPRKLHSMSHLKHSVICLPQGSLVIEMI